MLREGEGEVYKSQSKKGDMSQAGESSPVTPIAPHPVFAVEEQADDGSGQDAEEHAQPAGMDHGENNGIEFH
jgi:hypothetical protein